MKKCNILVILLMIICISSFSQRVLTIKDSTNIERINFSKYLLKKADIDNATLDSLILNTPINPDLSNYYKNIYKAEEYIMKGKYEKAAETYQTAFSLLEYPFKRDLDFALKCEMNSRQDGENIKKYIWFLVNKNEDKDQFLNDSTYYALPNWNEIKNMIDTTKSSINIGLAKEFKNILKDDQDARPGYHWTDSAFRQMGIVDSINYYKILDIIEKYPDIGEELIGTDGLFAMSIVFLHCKYRLDAFIKILPSVHSGHIDARWLVLSLSQSLYFCKNLYHISPVGNYSLSTIVSKTLNKDEILRLYIMPKKDWEITKPFRKNLYCEDINDINRKLIWQFKNCKYGDIYFKFYRMSYGVADESDLHKLLTEKNNLYGNKYKLYYRSREDKKRINKIIKEYIKNNPKNDTDTK